MAEGRDACEAILNRIRTANTSARAAASAAEYPAIERNYQQRTTLDRETILKTFLDHLHEYDAHVFEANPDTLACAIAEVLKSHDQKSAIVADDFPEEDLPTGFTWQRESKSTKDQLNTTGGAIAGCEVAIAHTGTIILRGTRQLTLLPDRFLCVVYENQIVDTVPEAMARLEPYKAEPLTFVSGPSATADIEMTRIRGVHGPRFLDVIVVRD
ncbi:LUD domain-containing protein [Alloacidobacterium dinghuense]|uniref:LUD domain-containing protein n=1 Tax=Alloacidobacterium dinghuense TaxID=2763107 RepID=A0A7G8BE43_9BACT|nr:LUD domain-containing protein [Alloacidobacterium dinghuense]QNI30813.1 LUD domain-containing protein [Alloacidobacterium dinghuense]